jgi:hypothetical protein
LYLLGYVSLATRRTKSRRALLGESDMDELLTPRDSADYRRTSIRTQDRERAEGRGPRYVRIGSRIYYRRRDVDTFIAAHLVSGERDGPETDGACATVAK